MKSGAIRDRIVELRRVPVGELAADPRNWRRHPKSQARALRSVLESVGYADALLARETPDGLVLIDGHLRAGLAADQVVPVLVLDVDAIEAATILATLDPLSAMAEADSEALEALLAEAAITDEDLLQAVSGYTRKIHKVGRTDPDDVPEPGGQRTRPGDLWQLGDHRLLCGDATTAAALERLLGDEKVPLTFTSFPYAVGLDYGEGYSDDIESLRALLAAVPMRLRERATPGGFVVTNFGDVVVGSGLAGATEPCEYPMAVEYWPTWRAAGWVLHTRRVWAKPHARVHSPWAIKSNRAATDWEHLWTWKAPGRGLNQRREISALGVWDTSHLEGVEIGKELHPAAFPAGIARIVLEVYSNPADLVLDPFAGTGTVMVAAEQTGRRAVGVELSPRFCDMAVARWEAFTGRTAERGR